MADGFINRLLAPKFILPLLLLVITLVIMATPVTEPEGATRLTTHGPDRAGARAFYEAAERFGWDVSRQEKMFADSIPRRRLYVLLAPPEPLAPSETHALLSAVRDGAGLLYVVPGENTLTDSLGIDLLPARVGGIANDVGIPASIRWDNNRCDNLLEQDPFNDESQRRTLALTDTTPLRDTVTLVQVIARDTAHPAALGATLGLGRIVVVSDPSFFRNDFVRLCESSGGILAFRLLEWLTEAAAVGQTLVFDEYHHGYGERPSTTVLMRKAMTDTTLGRTVLQVIAALLVLLAAVAVRPIPPRAFKRIERRSPIEHVGALSRAYEQIGATRRGTHLLVRGLRRRRDPGTWRRGTDEEFLHNVAARHPSVKEDVDRVLVASKRASTPEDFIHVGEAIEHIERTLLREHS